MTDREKLCVALVALALLPFSLALHGAVAVALWRWFAVPLGAPEIQIGHALGLMVLVNLTRSRPRSSDNETVAELLGRICGEAFVSPLFALFLGWLVKAVLL